MRPHAESRRMLLPLPEGEGRGEGEGACFHPSAHSLICAPMPSCRRPAHSSIESGQGPCYTTRVMHPRRERQSAVVFAGGKDFSPARGFSLLELLLVLGIMLVLGGLMYGTNSRSRQRAMQASCQKNLQTIALALQVYSGDFQSAFPLVKSTTTAEEPLSLLVPKYTSATEPFICPGTKDAALPEAESFKERRKIGRASCRERVCLAV